MKKKKGHKTTENFNTNYLTSLVTVSDAGY